MVVVLHNQTLLDIATQVTGTPNNALHISRYNGLIPSEEIKAGSVLKIPNNLINDEDIKRYYQANNILPATALTELQRDEITGCEGIGCWGIEVDFIVS